MDPGDFEELYNEIKQYPFTENQSLKLKTYFDNLYNSTYELNRKFSDSEIAYIKHAFDNGQHADRRSSYHPAAQPLDNIDIQNDSNSNSNRKTSKHTKNRNLSNSSHTKKRKRSKGGNTAKKTKK